MLLRRLLLEWILVLLACGLLVAGASWQGWTHPAGNWLFDQTTRLDARPPDDRILLIEIDNASIARFGRWPWPRSVHRKMMEALAPAAPAAVYYDVLFLEQDRDDAALAAAMRRVGKIFLPALIDRGNSGAGGNPLAANGALRARLVLPTPVLGAAATGIGAAEVVLDDDGVLRRAEAYVPLGNRPIPQIVTQIALARHADGTRSDQRLIRPFLLPLIHKDAFHRISFAAVASGEVPPEFLRGHILLIGATADGLGDAYAVSPSAGGLMPGIAVQANILNALLTDSAVQLSPPRSVFLLGLGFLLVVMMAFLRLGPDAHLRLTLTAMVVAVAATIGLAIAAHVWLSPGPALLGLAVAYTLWSWRRLAAIGAFVTREAAQLGSDPALAAMVQPRFTPGDPLQIEANHLHAIIAQLQGLRSFIARVVERLPDATCVVGPDDEVLLANHAADQLFGEAVVGHRLGQFLDRACEGNPPDGDALSGEFQRADGRRLMITEASLGDARRIVRLADVTDLRRAAEERAEMLQFLSHDLRAPNAAILMLLDTHAFAEGETASTGRPADLTPPPTAELPPVLPPVLPIALVERIRAYARQGLHLADDFVQLARARRRPISLAAVDLGDVAREAADMVWAKAVARKVAINDTSAGDEIWVMGDRAMLLRAIINLLDNAVKFAPSGQSVTYGVNYDAEANTAMLTVRGPGPPMPAGRRENPFALYADGRNTSGAGSTESIGLGLAFVEAVALRHDGIAAYEHEAGFGARFSLTLPLAPPE